MSARFVTTASTGLRPRAVGTRRVDEWEKHPRLDSLSFMRQNKQLCRIRCSDFSFTFLQRCQKGEMETVQSNVRPPLNLTIERVGEGEMETVDSCPRIY